MHQKMETVTLEDAVTLDDVLRRPESATEELEDMSAPIAPALIYAGYIAGASIVGAGAGYGAAAALD